MHDALVCASLDFDEIIRTSTHCTALLHAKSMRRMHCLIQFPFANALYWRLKHAIRAIHEEMNARRLLARKKYQKTYHFLLDELFRSFLAFRFADEHRSVVAYVGGGSRRGGAVPDPIRQTGSVRCDVSSCAVRLFVSIGVRFVGCFEA